MLIETRSIDYAYLNNHTINPSKIDPRNMKGFYAQREVHIAPNKPFESFSNLNHEIGHGWSYQVSFLKLSINEIINSIAEVDHDQLQFILEYILFSNEIVPLPDMLIDLSHSIMEVILKNIYSRSFLKVYSHTEEFTSFKTNRVIIGSKKSYAPNRNVGRNTESSAFFIQALALIVLENTIKYHFPDFNHEFTIKASKSDDHQRAINIVNRVVMEREWEHFPSAWDLGFRELGVRE